MYWQSTHLRPVHLLLSLLLILLIPVAAYAGVLTRVSVAGDGAEANGASGNASVSGDGRYIAFDSEATNLVPEDTNGCTDVFVHDRFTGVTERISVSSDGIEGNDYSGYPSISADGRIVVFQSLATNLVPGDTNNCGDIFVHDRATGNTARVSVATGNIQANGSSASASISADGRYVVFTSVATNLVPGITFTGYVQVFLYDRFTGHTSLESMDKNGTPAYGHCGTPSISAAGSVVAFASVAPNLAPEYTYNKSQIFVHWRASNITRMASDSPYNGDPANDGAFHPSLCGDGSDVVFESSASNYVRFYFSYPTQIWGHMGRNKTIVSENSDGGWANGDCIDASFSGDGHHVAFRSYATDLVVGDTNGFADIYVDRERVSLADDGTQPDADCDLPSISYNGGHIAFQSTATNLVPGDANGCADIFVYDRGFPQADAQLRAGAMDYLGDNIYGTDGIAQTLARVTPPATPVTYEVLVQNDGDAADSFRVTAPNMPAGWTAHYYTPAEEEVTAQVTNQTAGWLTGPLDPQASTWLRVVIQPDGSLTPGTTVDVPVYATSLADTSWTDKVVAHVSTPAYQPDGKIRQAGASAYLGDNIYNATGTNQASKCIVSGTTSTTFYVQVQNDGNIDDAFTVNAPAAPAGWTVKYYSPAGVEITEKVNNATAGWSTGPLAPQAFTYLRVVIKPNAGLPFEAECALPITARSVTDATRQDVVKAVVALPTLQPDAKIRPAEQIAYLGDNVYSADGSGQTAALRVTPGVGTLLFVQLQNDGNVPDSLLVTAPAAPAGWTVRYYLPAGTEVTGLVTNPAQGWSTGVLAPQATTYLRVILQRGTSVASARSCNLPVTARSAADPAKTDTVCIAATVHDYQPDAKIRLLADSAYLGENVYNTTGADQTVARLLLGVTFITCYVQVQNDGDVNAAYTVTAPAAPAGWAVIYYNPAGANITGQVRNPAGGWSTGTLAPQAYTYLRLVCWPVDQSITNLDCALPITARAAADPAQQDVVQVALKLRYLQPDAKVRLSWWSAYVGDNQYGADGNNGAAAQVVLPGNTATCFIQLQNDGNVPDGMLVTAIAPANGWTVKYYNPAGADITSQLMDPAGGWSTGALAPQAITYLRVTIKPPTGAWYPTTCNLHIIARSATDAAKVDAVNINNYSR